LSKVIEPALRLVRHQFDRAGVHVELKLDPHFRGVPSTARIKQVRLALMMNAMEAMPQGGNLWISWECNQEDRLCIIVRDDGAGIPAEILPRILEPFLTTKETGRGVGLGWLLAAAFSSVRTGRSRSTRPRHDVHAESALGPRESKRGDAGAGGHFRWQPGGYRKWTARANC